MNFICTILQGNLSSNMIGIQFPPTTDSRYKEISHNVKHLQDLCLRCIGEHLDSIPVVSRYLAPRFKEVLFEQLVNHDWLTPEYLPHITYNIFSSAMTKVHLYKSEQVTDSLLKILNKTACKLQWIYIHACPNITDEGIKMITKDQRELQRLEVRKQRITDKGLVNIQSPVLDYVDFRGCTSLTSTGIRDVLKKNGTIRMLNLALCTGLDEKVLSYVGATLGGKLETLDLTALSCLTDDGIIALAQACPNIKMLGMHGGCRVKAKGSAFLFEHCAQLRSLDLSYCTEIVHPLASLPQNLHELSLCGIQITDEELFVSSVSRLQNLALVRLCGVPALNDKTLTEIVEKIGKNLTHLDLSGSVMASISDDGLRSITKHCRKLENLALSLIRDITGESLIPMFEDKARAEAIRSLLLSCKKLSSAVGDAIASNCHNLEVLNIAGLGFVDDLLLNQLAENCPELNHINLKGCRNVTDDGVITLARRCSLRICILSGVHQITDRAIFALANSCPYLEELHLNGCSLVSPASVAYLRDQCIPRVWTTHKTPNASGDQLVARNLDTGNFGLAPATPSP